LYGFTALRLSRSHTLLLPFGRSGPTRVFVARRCARSGAAFLFLLRYPRTRPSNADPHYKLAFRVIGSELPDFATPPRGHGLTLSRQSTPASCCNNFAGPGEFLESGRTGNRWPTRAEAFVSHFSLELMILAPVNRSISSTFSFFSEHEARRYSGAGDLYTPTGSASHTLKSTAGATRRNSGVYAPIPSTAFTVKGARLWAHFSLSSLCSHAPSRPTSLARPDPLVCHTIKYHLPRRFYFRIDDVVISLAAYCPGYRFRYPKVIS